MPAAPVVSSAREFMKALVTLGLMALGGAFSACSQEVWVTLSNIPDESRAAEITAAVDGMPPPHALQRLSPIPSRFVAELGSRQGLLTLQAVALDGGECVIARGAATATLGDPGRYELDIPLSAAPGCVLQVQTAGPGQGSVWSEPMGIDCGASCDYRFTTGREAIRLVARPDALSYLSGWSGGCSGTDLVCELIVRQPTQVVATFGGVVPVVVQKSGGGRGTVTSDPPGISCDPTCSGNFPAGSAVTLVAQADPTSVFAGWSGACSGTAPCKLTLGGAALVTAAFLPNSLSVLSTGASGGAVILQPAGVPCGSQCGVFPLGSVVTLTPGASAPTCFTGWSGVCSGTGACQLTLNAPLSLSANFASCAWQPLGTAAFGQKVWGSGANDVWMTTGSPYLWHWDGSTMQSVGLSGGFGVFGTLAVWGSGPKDIWTGGGSGGTLEHWDGTAWGMRTLPIPDGTVSFYSLWGASGKDIWAVGRDYDTAGNAIVHWDGTTWSGRIPSTRSFQLNAVWGSGTNDVWAVGSLGIFHHDGSVAGFVQLAGVPGGWNGVWGSGPRDVWAVGDLGAILHFDGSAWSSVPSGVTASLSGVWGSGPSDVWAIGTANTLLRWDGRVWMPAPTGASSVSGTWLWGAAANDIWVVGSSIFRYHP